MRHLGLLCTCLLLAACGGKGDGRDDASTTDGALPVPAANPRSVTGMPDPGRPLSVPRDAVASEADVAIVEGESGLEPEAVADPQASEDGAPVGEAPMPAPEGEPPSQPAPVAPPPAPVPPAQ
ncbi:MAG: hypothetical protein J0L59_00690 [Xanthomonadales bacterium]|nr:hypothetical protein [Xanthomonadales bacterium]